MLNVKAVSSQVFLRVILVVCVIAVLVAGEVLPAAADNPPAVTPMSWADVTPVARFRSRGDWLVDMGLNKPEEVYGPFKGKTYKVGDTEQFFGLDIDNGRTDRRITATLNLITAHAYWWYEEGTDPDQSEVEKAGKRFENDIYPLDTMLFGDPWSPGIDGDPHIFILNQKKIGSYAVGVFSRKDECPKTLCRNSNQHELIYIGLDFGPPNSPQQLTVIAHEFQHLIEYNSDGNEERWLDEGLAQLAEHLNGFSPREIAGSNLRDFLASPNFQLDTWPLTADVDPGMNYAASYIFCVYLYQRFGTPFIQHLARSRLKGLAAVDETLRALKTGLTLDQVFADWTVTNYLNNPYVSDGRFAYQSLKLPQRVGVKTIKRGAQVNNDLDEYGADYLSLAGRGTYALTFTGDTSIKLAPDAPPSGQWMWWSYDEESGASRLEHAFDLTKARKPQLTFQAAWDIKRFSGQANILVSSDDGKHWKGLKTADMHACRIVDSDCFNGQSQGWQSESVDLSDYAGKKIRIRFEYVTLGSPQSGGLFIDDIAIPAIGYHDDVETLDSGWERQGFMRVQSEIPQQWAVSVITRDATPRVLPVKLNANNKGTLTFSTPDDGAVIAVAATAPFVESTAHYTLTVR